MAKTKPPSDVDKRLSAIFRGADGTIDLKTIERRRFPRGMAVMAALIAFLLLLAGAVWAGYVFLRPFGPLVSGGLDLGIEGPERISLGQETTYFINWRNVSAGPLAAVDVRVSFPTDFVPTHVEPRPTGDGLRWKLGSVAHASRGTFTVRGVFTGALNKETAVQAVGSYRPSSSNSDFEALATRSVVYAGTVVDGRLDLPPKALPGDKVRVAYEVRNDGSEPLRDLEMRLVLPRGFIREDLAARNGLDEGILRERIGDLGAGATASVAVIGTFAAGVTGNVDWHAELGREGADGAFQPVHLADAQMSVLGGDLMLKLVANGSDVDRSLAYGDLVRLAIAYENASPEELKDVVLRLLVEPLTASGTVDGSLEAPIDLAHVEMSPEGSTSSLPNLSWDKGAIGVLERLPPRQDGTIDVTLPTIGATSGAAAGFQLTVEASIAGIGNAKLSRTVRTAPLRFRFRSDADVVAEARYFSEEGAPLGSGPLPPVMGQTTTYRLSWTVSKRLHGITGMTVRATLPKSATWPSKASATAGDMAYDEATRTVTWTLNRLPEDVAEARAEFDVQFTPGESDVGRFADLMGETRFEATDETLGEKIVRTKPGLSTDLRNDDGAKNKGVVRKP